MTTQPGTGLAHVTVTAPLRRIDLALPEQVPVAELLPGLLRHAGESLADDGQRHGGWALRRADGERLELGRPLATQGVRHGDVLHLVPFQADWPEPEFDDIADAVAGGARRQAPPWDGRTTRTASLTVVGVIAAAGLYPVLAGAANPVLAGASALAVSVALILAGIALSRAMSDARAGAVLAAYGLPYAAVGSGLLVLGAAATGGTVPAGATVATGTAVTAGETVAAGLLVASATLLLASVLSFLGTAAGGRVFAAATVIAGCGVAGGALGLWRSPAEAAAIVTGALAVLVVGFPVAAMRLGKVPIPIVPREPGELAGEPAPDRGRVFAAVARADELLAGALVGAGVVHVACGLLLVDAGGVAAPLLCAIVAVANLLRARIFITVRHRLPLLGAGVAALAVLAVGLLGAADPTVAVLAGLGAAVTVGALVLAAGLAYSRRPPSPYLGRAAEILDVIVVIAVVPVAAAVLDLYAVVRGLAG